MSSFCITKKELRALLSALDIPLPYISMELVQLSELEENSIVDQLCTQGVLFRDDGNYIPAKGMKKHLFPIKAASDIILFNYGNNGTCVFNASIYFSVLGAVAIYEKTEDSIMCISLDSIEDVLTFLPGFGENNCDTFISNEEYISFFHFSGRGYSIAHIAYYKARTGCVTIEEKKQGNDSPLQEAIHEVSVDEYSEMLKEKIEDVYNVSCC